MKILCDACKYCKIFKKEVISMKCPECSILMKHEVEYISKDGYKDDFYRKQYHRCVLCKVKYTQDPWEEHWEIPPALRLTEAQIRTIAMIGNVLEIDTRFIKTRTQGIKFICEYLPTCMDTKESRNYSGGGDYCFH